MKSLIKIAFKIAMECKVDYVGLWSIPWNLQHEGYRSETYIELSLEVIREVAKLINVGFLETRGPGVEPVYWDRDLEEAICHIEQEWKSLGRLPRLGEIVWLTELEDPAEIV